MPTELVVYTPEISGATQHPALPYIEAGGDESAMNLEDAGAA